MNHVTKKTTTYLFHHILQGLRILILTFALTSFNSVYSPVLANEEEVKIWVISDIHYLSPQLHDKTGSAIQHIRNTAAGKDIDYGPERMEALIASIQKEAPHYLIVTGDLSLNGEYESMQDLAQYFKRIEALGCQVLLIPGNHDISSGWARFFKGEDFIKSRQVLPQDFENIFADYGYNQAIEHDDTTLSYLYPLSDNTWAMMLDSNIYSNTTGTGSPKTNGRIKKETLTWIKTQLKKAKKDGIKVIPILHHNSLDHHQVLNKNYTLDNAHDLRPILYQYQVELTLSGHIHTQHWAQIVEEDGKLTDLVTGAFSAAPSPIGKVHLSSDGDFSYQAQPLDLETWAKEIGSTDPHLLQYSHYMTNLFNEASRRFAFTEMIDGGWYHEDDPIMEEVADYVALLNLHYFSGQPVTPKDLSMIPHLQKVQTLVEQYGSPFFKTYLKQVLENQIDYQSYQGHL